MEDLRIEVSLRDGERDVRGEAVRRVADTLGIALPEVRVSDVYWVARPGGAIADAELARLAAAIIDPVVEVRGLPARGGFVEVGLHPGVTDPTAQTLVRVATRLGIAGLVAASGRRYSVDAAPELLAAVAERVVANPIIERFAIGRILQGAFVEASASAPGAETIPVRALDDEALVALSTARRMALDRDEMRAIREHFRHLAREPSDLELEIFAQTWSEHCVHKTFRALIDLEEVEADGSRTHSRVDGLLKTFIRAATETLARPWVRSAFVDNAGIVRLDDRYDLAIKVETHNHPSALEPFGGAATGMGGVIRDVIGVSARPFANLDVLCFAPADTPREALPPGALGPRRVADGVVHGIEDYGNKMGIPTVAGAVFYHPHYLTNPLVFCGTVGILPHGAHPTMPLDGDHVVVLGGRTGRDGLRGATFSSLAMDEATTRLSGGAVQIGHPIAEKQVLEVVLRARDERLYHAITDCGAGGLSSAVGEMGREVGAAIELERVPTKYPGLAPWEIWLSEAQERMVLAVPAASLPRLVAIAAEHESEVTSIGRFGHRDAEGPRIRIEHHGALVGDLSLDFLHDGIPKRHLGARWEAPPPRPEPPPEDLAAGLARRLRDPNLTTREAIVRRYDHEVQGGTVVRPLVGPGDGPSDAALIVPRELLREHVEGTPLVGVAIGVGLDPALGEVDPYAMAWSSVDEAVRNVVAVGADPDRVAILDNFSWGDPRLPDRLGALARCARGCHDAALAYGTPFVSGKDSLNNEWTAPDGTRHAIPPTLVITALGIMPDVRRAVTSALGEPGDVVYALGAMVDHAVPLPDADAPARYRALHRAILAGLVVSCHDVSQGGLAVALAEMERGARLQAQVDFAAAPGASGVREDRRPFCEGPGRHVVCVRPSDTEAFEACLAGHACARIGVVVALGSTPMQSPPSAGEAA